MKEIISTIFGTYIPVSTGVYNELGEFVGFSVASGAAGVDWEWIAGVVLFAIVLLSFFRMVGVLLKNG